MDAKATYLQSNKIRQEIFLKLPYDKLLKWKKTVNRSCDSSRVWHMAIRDAYIPLFG